jgi:glycosyltransferase involved in cell wall biosynthesis
MAAQTPDVTVVVAVYNHGPRIDGLLASLHAQTLPPGALEVVLVDDGGTDGTLERLQELASTRPYLVVQSIPNSGWPGRPRNVGLDAARGEFVFFADHDDEFFPESLSRMVSMARDNDADIVVGKVVRTGRPTPYWPLARRDVPVADPAGEVMSSRTVHKLYRRQWLLDLGARFPEGRVRLEDHVFTAQVLPHARVVSVLASYPCYRWIHRPDGTNSSDMAVDPRVYWPFYSGVLQTFEREAGPGRLLDEARRYAALQSFSRFPLREVQAMTAEQRTEFARAVHAYVAEQVPPSLDASLPVLKRLRLQALRDGGTERFLALHEASSRLTSRVALAGTAAFWQDGRLTLHAASQLVHRVSDPVDGGEPAEPEVAALERVGDEVLVPVQLLGSGPVARSAVSASATSADRSLLPADRGSLELTVRHRESGVEWPLGGDGESTLVGLGPGTPDRSVALRAQVSAVLDPATAAFGRPLEPGIWDVLARSQFLGEHQTRRLPVPGPSAGRSVVVLPKAPVAFPGADAELQGLLYRTVDGTLALKVTDPAAELARRPRVTAFAWEGDRLTMQLALGELHEPVELVVRARGGSADDDVLVAPVDGTVVTLDLGDDAADLLGSAVLDVFARPAAGADLPTSNHPSVRAAEQRVAYAVAPRDAGKAAEPEHQVHPAFAVYATTHGSLSVKRVASLRRRRHAPGLPAPQRSMLRRLLGR